MTKTTGKTAAKTASTKTPAKAAAKTATTKTGTTKTGTTKTKTPAKAAPTSVAKAVLGKKVPAFSAEATGGRIVSSKALAGRPYVLYFYPKDDTPGCTTEGRDFGERYQELRGHGVEVLGVSRDGLASHEKFKAKHGLPFDLVSDPDERLCRLFDVIREKSLYGRKYMGVERSTFLIDGAGILVKEWRKVKVNGHVENVLEAARSL